VTASYVFDEFTLDQARFQLRRGDAVVAVQPKVLRMLLHLAANRERAVGVEELLRVLWPGEYVGRGSIKRAIIGARRALGEAGDAQRTIRTVRGFGYQFARTVTEVPELNQGSRDELLVDDVDLALARTLSRLSEERVERLLRGLYGALLARGAAVAPAPAWSRRASGRRRAPRHQSQQQRQPAG
jgi:DNA-binding winged helix-turn-helix (wHTH) protein